MKINNIEFDDPRIFGSRKYDYKEYNEGSRTKVRSLWVDSWVYENGAKCFDAHILKITNYGSVSIDDKPIKDKKEQNEVKDIFEHLNFV